MAGIVKRIAAVLVSIVWLSLILVLLAGFFVPDLHELLPAPVREITEPEALREQWESFTNSLAEAIGVQSPPAPEATPTTTPDPAVSAPPTATPVPETPTVAPPTAEPATPTTAPSMSSDADDQPEAAETSVAVSVSEDRQADLRSAPSEDADVIGLVAAGGTVTVTARDSTGRWYRLEDGTWIDADDLVDAPQDQLPVVMVESVQPPPPEDEPTSDTPTDAPTTQLEAVTAVVNADSNLRAGPGTDFDRVDGVNFGEEVSVVGISADGEWYLLESGAWLFAALLVEAVDVPVVTEDTVSDELTTADTEQIDTGDDQAPAGTEQPDTETEQPESGDEQTETETEQPDAETEQPDTGDEQTETESDAEQLQPVVIAPLGANLRTGPGVEFDRVDGVEEGEVLTIVAQDEGGDWLKLEDGSWIFAALVNNVPADLPVDSGEAMEAETDETGADDETTDETTPPDASDDEQDVQAGDDAQDEQTDEDEQDTQTDEDEQDEQTDEDEQDTQEEAEQIVLATLNTDANLRNGPGLDATIVDSAPAGTQVTIVARSDNDQWLQLDNGYWIFATLVDILPAEEDENADTGTDDNNDG